MLSSSVSAKVVLDKNDTYHSLDMISGRVIMNVAAETTVKSVVVKLEGIGSTVLTVMEYENNGSSNGRREEKQKERKYKEEHKFLYEQMVVFPPVELARSSTSGIFTLKPSTYEYPFRFQIPATTSCKADSHKVFNHVQSALPPSFNQLGNFAEVKYFVKTTVNRSGMFKANARNILNFNFTPLDQPIRDLANARIGFVRRDVTIPVTHGTYRPEKSSAVTSSEELAARRKLQEDQFYNDRNSKSTSGSWGDRINSGSSSISTKIPVAGGIVGALGKSAASIADRLEEKSTQFNGRGQYSSDVKSSSSQTPSGPGAPKLATQNELPSAPSRKSSSFFSRIGSSMKEAAGINTWSGSTARFAFEVRYSSNAVFVPGFRLPIDIYLVFDANQGHTLPPNFPSDTIVLSDLVLLLHSKTVAQAENRSDQKQLRLEFFNAKVNQAISLRAATQRPGNQSIWEVKVPLTMVKESALPSFVVPSFRTCNIETTYVLEVAAGFVAMRNVKVEHVSVSLDAKVGSGLTLNDAAGPPMPARPAQVQYTGSSTSQGSYSDYQQSSSASIGGHSGYNQEPQGSYSNHNQGSSSSMSGQPSNPAPAFPEKQAVQSAAAPSHEENHEEPPPGYSELP